jgi:hypothetical protein
MADQPCPNRQEQQAELGALRVQADAMTVAVVEVKGSAAANRLLWEGPQFSSERWTVSGGGNGPQQLPQRPGPGGPRRQGPAVHHVQPLLLGEVDRRPGHPAVGHDHRDIRAVHRAGRALGVMQHIQLGQSVAQALRAGSLSACLLPPP